MQQDNNPNQALINNVFGSVFGQVQQNFNAQQNAPATTEPAATDVTPVSPIHMVKKKGNKIDLIRIANAIYELGMVEDANGARMVKQEFMKAFGKAFNLDLTDYDKDLSNSMSASVSEEKQTQIFEAMRKKHLEIYYEKI